MLIRIIRIIRIIMLRIKRIIILIRMVIMIVMIVMIVMIIMKILIIMIITTRMNDNRAERRVYVKFLTIFHMFPTPPCWLCGRVFFSYVRL